MMPRTQHATSQPLPTLYQPVQNVLSGPERCGARTGGASPAALADENDDDDDDDDYVPRLMGTDNYESEAWCCASLDRSEYDYAIGPSELEAVAGPHAQALVTHYHPPAWAPLSA